MPPKKAKQQQKSTSSVFENQDDNCLECAVIVVDGDSARRCDKCSKYIHGNCLEVNADFGELMAKLSGCYWYCISCNEDQRAKLELTRQTEKLSKIVNHIETFVTETPPLENSNKESNIIKKSIPNDECKCQIKLSGLPENFDTKSIFGDMQD